MIKYIDIILSVFATLGLAFIGAYLALDGTENAMMGVGIVVLACFSLGGLWRSYYERNERLEQEERWFWRHWSHLNQR